jgi:hypothetical protein
VTPCIAVEVYGRFGGSVYPECKQKESLQQTHVMTVQRSAVADVDVLIDGGRAGQLGILRLPTAHSSL